MKKDIIWSLRLIIKNQSRLIPDDFFRIVEKEEKQCISSGKIRLAFRNLARETGVEQQVSELFGSGCLWFGDAVAQERLIAVSAVRMPVDPKNGVSKGNTTVQMAFERNSEFIVDIGLRIGQKKEKELIGVLAFLLTYMHETGLRIGRLQTRGYGRLLLTGLQVGRYPVWTQKGIKAFLLKEMTEISDNPTELLSGLIKNFESHEPMDGKTVKFNLELHPVQGVMMPENVDYLPGTLLAGVLRRHSMAVLSILRIKDPQKFVNRMFGVAGSMSRLIVDDLDIAEGDIMTQSRVCLDDFTGGIIKDRAYRRKVVIRPTLRCNISFSDPGDAEIGLLVLVLRDLIFGKLAVGAGESIGFGLCEGVVDIKRGKEQWSIGTKTTGNNLESLNKFVSVLTGKTL